MNHHVNEGKREVNFSQFNSYRIKRKMRKFHEIAEQLEEDEMPLNSYLWIHRDAKLNDAEKKLIMDWANENEKKLAEQYPDSVPQK
jgi:exonuclease VII small subunit